jgi:iron-sulfur cluster assembly protein
MFRVTPQAANQIRNATLAANATEMALRVAAKRDANGEVEYAMGFDEGNENDTELSADGVRILISNHSAALLDDIELDYVELTPGEFNFIFVPGNVASALPKQSGGCGSGGCATGCSKQ